MIKLKSYILYKALNSAFLGLSLGSVFSIYAPLPPETYSIGGIILAFGAWVLALFYSRILNANSYKKILICIEIIPFCFVLCYLFSPDSMASALIIYCLYQITFIFGGYLGRAETLIFKHKKIISKLDIAKQIGYLAGLGAAFVFYQFLDFALNLKEQKEQIYALHFALLFTQSIIFLVLLNSLNLLNLKNKLFSAKRI